MLCDICKKNQATIHIQEIVGGEKKAIHICPQCAAEKSQDDPVLQGFNLAEMLYNLSGQLGVPLQESDEEPSGGEPDSQVLLACPTCGWNSTSFRKTGRLGCSDCYKTFKEPLEQALKNMHRGVLHVGKKPGKTAAAVGKSSKVMMEIMNLQKELEELIQREEYEKAATVRDKINSLKKKSPGKKGSRE